MMIVDEVIIAAVVVTVLYTWYYVTKCGRPIIVAAHNSILVQKLLDDCPILSSVFYPCLFFAQPDLQSLTREITDKICSIKIKTKTTSLLLPDGGEVCYTEPLDQTGDKSLIVVIVPGYMGDHKTTYMLQLLQLLHDNHIWPVIFTDRGKGGMSLKSPKFFSAGYNDGLALLLDTIIEDNPDSHYAVLGVSFGGMVAANTLSKYHRRDQISAQILVSTPLDSKRTVQRLNAMGRAKLLYSVPYGSRIKTLIRNNERMFHSTANHKMLYRHLMKSNSMTEIDNRFIAPMFGYPDADAYYNDICLANTLPTIDLFTICINSDDDPCFSSEMFPISAIRANPKVCLVRTRAGGHYGFAGLLWPITKTTFSDKIIHQILAMIKKDVT